MTRRVRKAYAEFLEFAIRGRVLRVEANCFSDAMCAVQTTRDPRDDKRLIVENRSSSGKLFYRSQNGIEKRRGLQAALLQDCIEPLRSKQVIHRVVCLGDAVGIEDDLVAFSKAMELFFVDDVGLHAQRQKE